MRSFNFCNNCGKNGHVFQSCKEPITSVGIIAYKYDIDNQIKYLMICRKDTLGYVDFIRGRYSLNNIDYILNLINIMTVEEKKKILTLSFVDLWKDLWGNNIGIQYRGEETFAKEKFNKLSNGYTVNGIFINLKKFDNMSTSLWKEPEWGFPKGRRNYQEKDLYCAIREFCEETGHENDDINIINNINPYEEIFLGSNFKSYKHKYFIANIKNNIIAKNTHQLSEVSKVEWKSLNNCISSIRNYNLEKVELLKKINNILLENNLCI
mgnify:FL=1|tara:strand:+ start:2325 stop:3122 length:798 start_codon:yes stop_codon:yes gene_type:complete